MKENKLSIEQRIMIELSENPYSTIETLSRSLSVKQKTIREMISKMKSKGIITTAKVILPIGKKVSVEAK